MTHADPRGGNHPEPTEERALKVAVTQPIYEDSLQRLKDAGLDVVELWRTESGQAPTLVDVDAVVSQLTDRIDATYFEDKPRLKVVANVAVGYDNIDVAAATAAGVIVTNTPGVLTDATADLALALLLATARRVPEGDELLRRGGFEGWELLQHPMGVDVTGQILGIVGMGRVGQAVARRAHHGFGMAVLYVDAQPVPEMEETLGARRVELPEALASSDFVSLHAPLTPDTRHLINREALAAMKPTAILINTARGPLIDEDALAEALAEGVILGAGLDVFEAEPLVHPRLLERRERVVLTPHLGSATESTRRRMSTMAVENVIAVVQGRPALNPVTS